MFSYFFFGSGGGGAALCGAVVYFPVDVGFTIEDDDWVFFEYDSAKNDLEKVEIGEVGVVNEEVL